jgi:hypothetical protein
VQKVARLRKTRQPQDGGRTCEAPGSGTNLCPDPIPTYPNAVTTCDPATGNISTTCLTGFIDVNGDITDGTPALQTEMAS